MPVTINGATGATTPATTFSGSTSGSIAVQATAVAGSNTLTLPAATGTFLTTAGGQTISGTTTLTTLNATTIQVGGNLAVNGPAFSAYQSSSTSMGNNTFVKIAFNAENFDTNNNFDSTTNYRFTPTVAGYYYISLTVGAGTSGPNGTCLAFIYKNGTITRIQSVSGYQNGVVNPVANCSGLIYLNGSTDYVEGYGMQNTGSTQNSNTSSCEFSGFLARGA